MNKILEGIVFTHLFIKRAGELIEEEKSKSKEKH